MSQPACTGGGCCCPWKAGEPGSLPCVRCNKGDELPQCVQHTLCGLPLALGSQNFFFSLSNVRLNKSKELLMEESCSSVGWPSVCLLFILLPDLSQIENHQRNALAMPQSWSLTLPASLPRAWLELPPCQGRGGLQWRWRVGT